MTILSQTVCCMSNHNGFIPTPLRSVVNIVKRPQSEALCYTNQKPFCLYAAISRCISSYMSLIASLTLRWLYTAPSVVFLCPQRFINNDAACPTVPPFKTTSLQTSCASLYCGSVLLIHRDTFHAFQLLCPLYSLAKSAVNPRPMRAGI